METNLIRISRNEIKTISTALSKGPVDYTDHQFLREYGLSISPKNKTISTPIFTENLKNYPYIFLRYISKKYIDVSEVLKRIIDCRNFIEQSKNKDEIIKLHAEIESLEQFLLNNDPDSFESRKINGIKKDDFLTLPARILGLMESSFIYEENVVLSAARGHGFAAEKANHLWDVMSGKDAKIVGGDNAKDGADRVVNGVSIQTKYCSTGSKCVENCFRNEKFRYFNTDGSPMQVEVPSDKYDDAIKAMKSRIAKGQVPGVTDQDEAAKIIRKGNFTYAQARNIAKFGTIESLTYDAVNGITLSCQAAGLSAVISFASAVWSGDEWQDALEKSCYAGLKVGGTAWASSILASQVGRTGIEQSLRGATDWVVNSIGYKASAIISNAIRSGKDIYGAAAANYLSKVLRGNVVTGVITTTVISTADFYQLFKGRISGAQAFKNISLTATSVAGGTGGWMAGATAGAAIGSAIPVIGTAAGGIIGGVLGSFGGGWAASKVTKSTLDLMIKEDGEEMYEIIKDQFPAVANDYLLSQEEADSVIDDIQNGMTDDLLKTMYASSKRNKFAYSWMEKFAQNILHKREVIRKLPTSAEMDSETAKIILNNINATIESDIITLKYTGTISSVVTSSITKQHYMAGTIIPANYNCPIYETEDFNLYVPFDCIVIDCLSGDTIDPGMNLVRVIELH